jgi:hypothetical protein
MLHWWLIPAAVIVLLVLWGFYLILGRQGGSGQRTEGRTLVDKPGDEPSQD